jgi:predicted N-acyltransferase
MLYASPEDMRAAKSCQMLERQTIQFHWTNSDSQGLAYESFDAFLSSMSQEKRKKIKQERKKVDRSTGDLQNPRGYANGE